MAHIQRLGAIGIGLEATPGTAVSPTHWLQAEGNPSMKDNYEFENVETAIGRVERSQAQKLMRKKGEGSVDLILDQTACVLLFDMILGSASSASAGGGKYAHTIVTANSNTPKTATLVMDRIADIRKFPYTVATGLTLKIADSFAMMKLDFVSQESATATSTDTYSTVTNFSFKELSVKFGADVSAANAASATPLSGVDLEIKREAEVIYQTGSNTPVKIAHKTLEVSGNYSLLFEDATVRDKYLNETANAMILTFTDANSNIVKITLSKVNIKNWEPTNDLNEIVVQSADFEGFYDASQTEAIRVVVTNDTSSYTNL